MARDRPSPYGQRREFVSVTVARGPVPRERLGYRSAGACPPRSQHGEGQALALRYSVRFQHGAGQARALRPTEIHKVTVARRPSDATRASERVSPAIASVTVARGPSDATRASERVSTAFVAWRGTGPRPTVFGAVSAWRGTGPRPTANGDS